MGDLEETMRSETGTKARGPAVRTVDIELCGMFCALTRPLRDSGMMPGTDRYVEHEQRNNEVKRVLRDA